MVKFELNDKEVEVSVKFFIEEIDGEIRLMAKNPNGDSFLVLYIDKEGYLNRWASASKVKGLKLSNGGFICNQHEKGTKEERRDDD